MSPKRAGSLASPKVSPPESPIKDNGTDNGCLNSNSNRIQTSFGAAWSALSAGEQAAVTARFWAKVERRAGCWLWRGSVTGRSVQHGQFTFTAFGTQVHIKAHRFAWMLVHGAIPPGLNICHHCDVARCCNVKHLFLGTQSENLDDARQKGRLVDGLGARKLSDDAYRDILTEPFTYGSGRRLAKKYGVSHISISRIRNGQQGSTFRQDRGGLLRGEVA